MQNSCSVHITFQGGWHIIVGELPAWWCFEMAIAGAGQEAVGRQGENRGRGGDPKVLEGCGKGAP